MNDWTPSLVEARLAEAAFVLKRLAAAQQLGLKTAPVHVAKGLSEAQARAFRIMDNRSGENAEWADDLLGLELSDLLEADYDLGLTGFTDEELNGLLNGLAEGDGAQEGEDDIPETPEDPISRPGDLWVLAIVAPACMHPRLRAAGIARTMIAGCRSPINARHAWIIRLFPISCRTRCPHADPAPISGSCDCGDLPVL